MEGTYEVYQGNKAAGKVQVIRQGLYLRIICRCRIEGQQVYRLFAASGNHRENLGVMVPEGDGFVLDKKIPAKRLPDAAVRFVLSATAGELEGKFVPICPEEPFLYIDRLKTAFLELQQGKVGIRIQETPETA